MQSKRGNLNAKEAAQYAKEAAQYADEGVLPAEFLSAYALLQLTYAALSNTDQAAWKAEREALFNECQENLVLSDERKVGFTTLARNFKALIAQADSTNTAASSTSASAKNGTEGGKTATQGVTRGEKKKSIQTDKRQEKTIQRDKVGTTEGPGVSNKPSSGNRRWR